MVKGELESTWEASLSEKGKVGEVFFDKLLILCRCTTFGTYIELVELFITHIVLIMFKEV